MMNQLPRLSIIVLAFAVAPLQAGEDHLYRVVLKSPGGRLPFLLSIDQRDGQFVGTIHNGPQRIELPGMIVTAEQMVIPIAHYDSEIRLKRSASTNDTPPVLMRGTWRKRSNKDEWTELQVWLEPVDAAHSDLFLKTGNATAGNSTLADDVARIEGRWRIDFSKASDAAIGEFKATADGTVTGTILTTTGDYGFLAGRIDGGRLRLSNFDGAHAFLFDVRLRGDGTLAGDFWSRDTWHETWTATRDSTVELADPYAISKWNAAANLSKLRFPDLDGVDRNLTEVAFKGKAQIIEVFGSWCPNRYDAATYLGELHRRYGDLGLGVVGLAFELTGDFDRDAAQVRKFAKRCKADYPILVAGMRGRDEVAAALPMLDDFKAYPTIIVLSGTGEVEAIHTGFSGPATGKTYIEQQKKLEAMIERLLNK